MSFFDSIGDFLGDAVEGVGDFLGEAADFIEPIAGFMTGGPIGAITGMAASAFGQHSANQVGTGRAREQMAFQERMSSTAYQRAMADMKAAGLNPMLAYSQGGASTPAGAMPNIGNVGAAAGQNLSTAVQMKRLEADIANVVANTNAAKASEALTREAINTERTKQSMNSSSVYQNLMAGDLSGAMRLESIERAKKTIAEAISERFRHPYMKREADLWKSELGGVKFGSDKAAESVGAWKDAVNPMLRGNSGRSIHYGR